MRPYRLHTGMWVDLDHVLMVGEPQTWALWQFYAALQVQLVLAFRDNPYTVVAQSFEMPECEAKYVPDGVLVPNSAGEYVDARTLKFDETRLYAVVRERIWQPLYDAWTQGKGA